MQHFEVLKLVLVNERRQMESDIDIAANGGGSGNVVSQTCVRERRWQSAGRRRVNRYVCSSAAGGNGWKSNRRIVHQIADVRACAGGNRLRLAVDAGVENRSDFSLRQRAIIEGNLVHVSLELEATISAADPKRISSTIGISRSIGSSLQNPANVNLDLPGCGIISSGYISQGV